MADAAEVNAKHKRQQVRGAVHDVSFAPYLEEKIPAYLRRDIVPGKQRLMSIGPKEESRAHRPRIPIPELARRHAVKLGNMQNGHGYTS